MTKEEKIEKFINAGAKRWKKKNMDRLYISPRVLGYKWGYYKSKNKWSYYKSRNICYAYDQNGNKIPNSQMYMILVGKIWLDINNDFAVHNDSDLEDELVKTFITKALES